MPLKLISWNVNGIRAGIKKGFWEKYKQVLKPDLMAIQETKSDAQIMDELALKYPDYNFVYHSALKKGYSGVANIWPSQDVLEAQSNLLFEVDTKIESEIQTESVLEIVWSKIGIGNPKFDEEGRFVASKFQIKNQFQSNYQVQDFVLINCYYPQGGRGYHRIEYKIEFYKLVLKYALELKKQGEKVILCGDFNTTVTDIDLARPKQNKNTTGCLPEEREVLEDFFKAGFIDSFRKFYPETAEKYSYWDQKTKARERNVGWRIDYFLVDKDLLPQLHKAEILDQIYGSDHCPVMIELN